MESSGGLSAKNHSIMEEHQKETVILAIPSIPPMPQADLVNNAI